MILSSQLSTIDKLYSIFFALDTIFRINSFRVLLRFKNCYKNYASIFKEEKKNNYPINCILKNNEKIILYHKKDISLLTHDNLWENCKFIKDFLYMKKGNHNLTFYKSHLGDMVAVFAKQQYQISIKDKVMIDVGAAIGDSAILAASMGCKKVIAVEPLKINFEIMKKNIHLNNMEHLIIPINAALTYEQFIIIDSTLSGPGNRLFNDYKSNQQQIPGITLEKLIDNLKQYNVNQNENLILKIDCEGCEYDLITKTPDKILKKFEIISMEYHFGYQSLKKRLESIGFDVQCTKPKHVFGGDGSYFGYLYAKQKKNH